MRRLRIVSRGPFPLVTPEQHNQMIHDLSQKILDHAANINDNPALVVDALIHAALIVAVHLENRTGSKCGEMLHSTFMRRYNDLLSLTNASKGVLQ